MIKRKLTGAVLATVMAAALVTGFNPDLVRADGVDDFVTRCYSVAFGREPDQGGFDFWKGQIAEGKIDGSATVYNFIFSPEYIGQNTDDQKFVKDLYTMFMGREPDQAGYDFWCRQLKEGKSRNDLFAGFANSAEFNKICSDYNITAGYFTDAYSLDQVNKVNLFVERLYKICLGRTGDQEGQNFWVNGLLNGDLTGIACAANFIKSNEYAPKRFNTKDYIKDLYRAFMGREADNGGYLFWKNAYDNQGLSPDAVFAGFAFSKEFADICASYGINVGSDFTAEKSVFSNWAAFQYRDDNKLASINYNGDFTTFEYNADGYISKAIAYDKDAKLQFWHTYEYDSAGNRIKESLFSEDGKLASYSLYEYDERGNTTKVEGFNVADGKESSSGATFSTYDEEDSPTSEKYVNPDGSYEFISWDKNNSYPVREESHAKDGTLLAYTEREFDQQGRPTVAKYYEDNKLLTTSSFEYNDKGLLTKESRYDAISSEISYSLYEYYQDGSLKKSSEYHDGELRETAEYAKDGSSKSSYYAEGKLLTEWIYDVNANLVRENTYQDGELISYSVNEFKDTRVSRKMNYDAAGKVTSYDVYSYNDNGIPVTTDHYDAEGKLISSDFTEYDKNGNSAVLRNGAKDAKGDYIYLNEYDNGNLIKSSHYDNGKLQEYYQYEYSSDNVLIKESRYNGNDQIVEVSEYYSENVGYPDKVTYYKDGKIDRYTMTEFDEEHNIVVATTYSAKGIIMEKVEGNGDVVTNYRYDENGKLVSYDVEERNTDGVPLKNSTYDADGKLKEYYVNELNDDGYCTKTITYDADGKLIQTKVYDYSDMLNITAKIYDADGNLISEGPAY